MTLTVALFGVMAIAFIGHALFINGPVDDVEDLSRPVDPEDVSEVLVVPQINE